MCYFNCRTLFHVSCCIVKDIPGNNGTKISLLLSEIRVKKSKELLLLSNTNQPILQVRLVSAVLKLLQERLSK